MKTWQLSNRKTNSVGSLVIAALSVGCLVGVAIGEDKGAFALLGLILGISSYVCLALQAHSITLHYDGTVIFLCLLRRHVMHASDIPRICWMSAGPGWLSRLIHGERQGLAWIGSGLGLASPRFAASLRVFCDIATSLREHDPETALRLHGEGLLGLESRTVSMDELRREL